MRESSNLPFRNNCQTAKSDVRLVCRARLDYRGFCRVCEQVRKQTDLRKPAGSRRLPKILSDTSLNRFFDAIQRSGNLQHEIMLKLLFYTAVRVSELASIRVEDVDLDGCKIFSSMLQRKARRRELARTLDSWA